MSTYALEDFIETLDRVDLPSKPALVVGAWGDTPDRQGWALGDWSGGFLLDLEDGSRAYITGWCDYSGWGCQDGATVEFTPAVPGDMPVDLSIESISARPKEAWETRPALEDWDRLPADLNKWLADRAG